MGNELMKLLHCADLHLDSPLRGLTDYEGAPVDEIRGATRRAMENLIDLAVDERVAVVVIAGDVYDGDRDDFNTAMFLQRQFERLRDEGIAAALVHGNHDAANGITRRLRLPDNVYVFPHDTAATHLIDHAGLALHGRSYPDRVVNENFAVTYPAPTAGLLNVGVLHTSLSGHGGPHQVYAPCTEQNLVDRGYEYWALGHVHERYETCRDGTWIVYPGNLQGRKSIEAGPKGATLVSYDHNGVVSVQHRDLDVVRWAVLDVDVADLADVEDLPSRVVGALGPMVSESDGRLLACRVRIGGRSSLASAIRRAAEVCQAQVRADAAGASSRVWIEKIQLRVEEPSEHSTDAGEAIAAVRAAAASASADPETLAEIAREFAGLASAFGAEMPGLVELGAPTLDADGIAALLPEIEAMVIAQLNDIEI